MEPFASGWLVIILNGIVIALILTVPILAMILIVRVVRTALRKTGRNMRMTSG